jgi:hypothetical protein
MARRVIPPRTRRHDAARGFFAVLGIVQVTTLRRPSMLNSDLALRRVAAILLIAAVLAVTLVLPAWCVSTGLWW